MKIESVIWGAASLPRPVDHWPSPVVGTGTGCDARKSVRKTPTSSTATTIPTAVPRPRLTSSPAAFFCVDITTLTRTSTAPTMSPARDGRMTFLTFGKTKLMTPADVSMKRPKPIMPTYLMSLPPFDSTNSTRPRDKSPKMIPSARAIPPGTNQVMLTTVCCIRSSCILGFRPSCEPGAPQPGSLEFRRVAEISLAHAVLNATVRSTHHGQNIRRSVSR